MGEEEGSQEKKTGRRKEKRGEGRERNRRSGREEEEEEGEKREGSLFTKIKKQDGYT